MPPYMSPLLIQFTPDHTVHTCHYILSYSSHLPLYLDTSSYTGDHTVHTCHYILMHVHTLPPQRSVHGCCCGTRSSLCSALAPVWWSCGICSPHNTLLCLWCCLFVLGQCSRSHRALAAQTAVQGWAESASWAALRPFAKQNRWSNATWLRKPPIRAQSSGGASGARCLLFNIALGHAINAWNLQLDLVGFTALSIGAPPLQLAHEVRDFENMYKF